MKTIKNLLLLLSVAITSQVVALHTNYKKPALKTLKKENRTLRKLAKIYKRNKVNVSTRKLLDQYITNAEMITSLTKHMFELEKQNNQKLLDIVRLNLLEKKAENQKILLDILMA